MNQNNNFMDSRTLWAILLVGIVWFGWQHYISQKYGNQTAVVEVKSTDQNQIQETPLNVGSPSVSTHENSDNKSMSSEKLVPFFNSSLQGVISSKGMSLKRVQLLKFKSRNGHQIEFSGGDSGLFSTSMNGKNIDFEIKDVGNGTFIGIGIDGDTKIQKKLVFSDGYKVEIETQFDKANGSILPFSLSLGEELKNVDTGSIFSPAIETQDVLIINSEGEKEVSISGKSEPQTLNVSGVLLASVNGHYFSAAYLDKSEIMPNFSLDHNPSHSSLAGVLSYSVGSNRTAFTLKGVGYIGPKEIGTLESVDPLLPRVVKFGFFSAVAKPLLITMKWLYGMVGNWGWSIILLTLLVRMIVMPLHIMSFRSMKAMQKVQPLIQNLRERYKDDALTLNREMMDLMKKHKVNPMGGCLPMLLQIPVFFALYRVFSESIELYQSPFIFWIHDLSIKDPFFVLPVLMATVMYLQQKITPSTMDPAQAKVMQFMPLIFSLMMISLPSALTLYMFVSTFFGILQQYLFLKDKTTLVTVK